MNRAARIAEVERRLAAWAATLAEFDRQIEAFCELTTAQPDSPLLESIHRLEEAYTRAVAEQVGDADGWLSWFRWECDMGLKPLDASARAGAPMRKVRTVKHLARMVVA